MRNEIQVAGQQTGIKLRPYEHHAKYYETDQMGIIHHSNYVKWMEEARMDLMDQMGLSYKQMEEMEIISIFGRFLTARHHSLKNGNNW